MSKGPSDRSRAVALALAAVLGPFGGHRFYVGKNGTGALMAITLGGMGLWWLYDVILIGTGSFRDAEGRLVARWESEADLEHDRVLPTAALEELEQLRAEVAEIQERLDFTERLLARPRPDVSQQRHEITPV
jgi:hypothetical protein